MTTRPVASIDWQCEHTAILRIHPPGGGLGKPYLWACTLVRDGDVAVLRGAVGDMPPGGRAAACEAGLAASLTGVRWERLVGNKIRTTRVFDISKGGNK